MKIRLSLAMVLAGLSAAAAVEVSADRPNALYACGEKAVMTVRVTDAAGNLLPTGSVSVALDNFGERRQLERTADLAAGNPFTVEGTLSEPGFLRLVLKGTGVEGVFSWSVGYEPNRIRPVTPVPADFDAFWAAARKRLADEVPLDSKVERVVERSTPDIDFYRISFATFGRRVHGYMSVPTDPAKKPYAVSMEVAAAGFGDWTNNMKALPDRICVFFGVYPFALDWDWEKHGLKAKFKAYSEGLARQYGCSNYATSGVGSSREECFYYPVILGIDRAIDWIAARPDVDRTRFAYHGTSQGGGMGLILTGLNKNIRRAALFVPAMTDTLAGLAGRQSGWPQPVEAQKAEASKEKVKSVMPYFDAASFARRITCPVRFAVGLSDVTCAPHCTWGAFNAVASSDKRLYYGLGMGHNCRQEFYTALETWVHGTEEVRVLPGMNAGSDR